MWLDGDRFKPFDFYQYWINVDDRDVAKLLKLYTFLPLDEIAELEALQGADIRRAKAVLAYEVTKRVHGEDAANEAREGAKAMVSGKAAADLPTHVVSGDALDAGLPLVNVLADAALTGSSEARRMIKGGAVKLDSGRWRHRCGLWRAGGRCRRGAPCRKEAGRSGGRG